VTITLNAQGLQLNGQTLPVYSGTVHFWRLDRDKWPRILDQVKSLGFDMIETYITWSAHETAPGQFDWGQGDPRKDLEAFLELCEARGLWLLARPGPLINAELTDFGFPEWVLMDPAVQARTALDTIHFDAAWGLHPPHQFPVPSYASEKFYEYVAGWFDAVCPILARHRAPQGCVVAVQSDNETCYLFHDQAYATDYSPASLALYRSMLKDSYGSLAALNAAYGREYPDFSAVEPPRDCEVQTRADVARHLDWVKYKEYQIRWSVARLARMMRERGLVGVPIFHDVAFQWQSPLDITAMEAHPEIDWVGMNLYANQDDYPNAMTRIRYLAGSTRLPFVPEFGCGLWSHHAHTFTPEEHEFITLSALLHGLKAFNFYMLAERDRWQGSAITRHGELRPERAPFYRALNGFLQRHRFWEFERQRETIVLFNYDAGRFAALASTLHYAHVDLLGLPPELTEVDLDLGLQWDPRLEAEVRPGSWLGVVTAWLAARHVPYDFGDTHLTADQLRRYTLVCVPTVDFLDACAQAELLKYAEGGGRLLIGPLLPRHDPTFKPCATLSQPLAAPGTTGIGAGSLTWADVSTVATHLSALAPTAEYTCDQPRVDLAVHRRGGQTLLFAVNPTAQALTVTLSFSGARALHSAWSATPPLAGDSAVTVALPAYTVYIWEVRRD
jgi:beta-galactosidase